MRIAVPELSLVVLIGPSGSGKSTFARKHFKPTEVVSSDGCRALVADDENDQSATELAFRILNAIAAARLEAGRLTVIDATNVQAEARRPFVALAREYHCIPVAIVLDLPERVCTDRNRDRSDRAFGAHVVRGQRSALSRSLRGLKREGFRHIYRLRTPEEVEATEVERQPLWNDRREEHGPFDIIGDVHGCFAELTTLLKMLGHVIVEDNGSCAVTPPEGRRAIFLGDLVDRGPDIVKVLRLAMGMAKAGTALVVPGNHDMKLLKALRGKQVSASHGLVSSLEQLGQQPAEFREEVAQFFDGLVSHYVLDDGRLVVAHAGMKAEMQGRGSGKVREFALYGETTGETDEYGLPVRVDWASEYRGNAMVVYGHTPVAETEWVNRTINIDTGCVFGGALTALRYPERELVSVPAGRVYYEPAKPIDQKAPPPERPADVLDLEDVSGKRVIRTGLHRTVTVREDNARAALEVMSRFAADPRWLIYLPPTMSPCESSREEGYLEHPAEAFSYYRRAGVQRVICEKKHMGSRAVVIVCRNPEAAARRFGVSDGSSGACLTRTGRPFFDNPPLEPELLERVRAGLSVAGLWDELETDWFCLDCELMPWSVKAQELLRDQYASTGAAARAGLSSAVAWLERAAAGGQELTMELERAKARLMLAGRYSDAYGQYCWPVRSVDDLRLAPFHVLATEGKVHVDRDHAWHMAFAQRLAQSAGPLVVPTLYRCVETGNDRSLADATMWWVELTENGGEGMVVKPDSFVARHRGTLVQPAVKCRGREYLRIIYGPEYTLPANLERLRSRGVSTKRSLALREFALGIEALRRFVDGEPLYTVHECVFAVLALESEPVDPRL